MSDRIEYLRMKAASAKSYICGERGRIITDSYRATEGEDPVIRRADRKSTRLNSSHS